MEGDGVQVFVESSWNVLQGSLDKCVTVVFLDPETHDPIISTSPRASEKLVLVPPTEPVPCEITVTFQGRLCHVQSFYTLSTARICELYSQSKPKTDGDYICTVKGWIPYENSCFSEEGTEMVSEAADATHRNGMKETGFLEDNTDESVLSSVGSSTVTLNPVVDVKSVSSSSDDSWVDVRLHRSFTGENACVSLTAPECENWHVPLNEHELVNLEDQLVLGNKLRSKAKAKDTGVEGDSKPDECCEGGVQFKEHIVQGNAQQDMFEAELELVNHSPWAAITIRLLSLQNKSLVEVDQIVFLAVSGPVPEAASPCQSADQGAHSLFAMFVPSLLQMSRGISGNSKSVLKCESSSLSCEQAQDMIDKLSAEKMSHSCEPPQGMMGKLPAGAEQIGITPLQNAVTEGGSVRQQDSLGRAAYVHTHEACAASKAGSLLNLGDQEISQHCDFNGAESQGTVEIGENQEISQQSDFNIAESKRTVEMGNDQEISQKIYSNEAESKRAVEMGEEPFQSDSNVIPSCNREKIAGDFMANGVVSALEAFSERFDRLESLCLRMESYLQRTFENLEQRIMHLEVQHRKGSEEAECVTASLKQSSMSVEAHNSQESGKQCTAPSDLPPRAECKEEVSISLTQSIEQVYSEAHVFNEVPNPILFDVMNSDSAAPEKFVKEAPSESQEVSRGSVTMVGSMTTQNKKPPAFLDEAWASALSAFASSFTPVVGAETTVANQMDEKPSGSTHDALISTSQECETLRKERKSTKATSHCDVDSVADLMNEANREDSNSEAFNFEDGPIYEDGAQAPCDEQMPTAHAFPIGTSLEKPDNLLSSYSSKTSISVLNDSFDLLGLKDMLIMPSKARTAVNDSLEDMDLATTQGFSGLSEDALSACPLFDILASAHSNPMSLREPKDNSPALRGFKTGLSPVFDSTTSEMQDADFLSLGKEETLSNNFSKCQKSRNFFHFEEKNKDYLYNFDDKTLTEGAGFRSISSLIIGASKASQTEENKEEVFCNTSDSSTVDLLGNFISREKGRVLDMSEVQDSEFFNSNLFTYCEVESPTSFPDVLEEDCSNYQDGRASSEDSLCFSQDFDTCPNELCDDEWSCGPNVFYLNDPELTDDETNIAVAGVEDKIEMSDISDTDSAEDLPFWPAVHNERIDQQQPTTVFPGFENLS